MINLCFYSTTKSIFVKFVIMKLRLLLFLTFCWLCRRYTAKEVQSGRQIKSASGIRFTQTINNLIDKKLSILHFDNNYLFICQHKLKSCIGLRWREDFGYERFWLWSEAKPITIPKRGKPFLKPLCDSVKICLAMWLVISWLGWATTMSSYSLFYLQEPLG